jgi:hypothetical protein
VFTEGRGTTPTFLHRDAERSLSQLSKESKAHMVFSLINKRQIQHIRHAATCGVLTLAAAGLHFHTLKLIRRFHPEYPGFVTLGVYTPSEAVKFLHANGFLLVLFGTAVAAILAYRNSKREPYSPRFQTAVFVAHTAVLLAALAVYGLAWYQVAGVAGWHYTR